MMLVSLYTSRILLAALGVVDYGLYNVVGGVVVMIGFFQGTMATASARFVTVALGQGDLNNMKRVFSSLLFVNIFLAILIFLFAETIGLWFLQNKMTIPESRTHASMWVYQLSVISVCTNIITVPFNASIISHERMGAFAYISLFDALAKLFIAYLIVISKFDKLILYALLVFLTHIIDIFIYYLYCIKHFPETKTTLIYDKSSIKKILSFITWASYGSLASVGFTQGLNIILNIFFGPAVNAARGIAVQVQNAVVNFTVNFQTAINPQLMKLTTKHDFENTQRLLIYSSKYSFFLLCIIGLPLIVETPFILECWLDKVPNYSISFCRIILIISIWGALANPLRIVNHAEGNIKKFQLCECTLLLLIMPISYCLLKCWQIPILVFIVHLIIEVFAQFIRIIIVTQKINMSFTKYIHQIYLRIIPVFFIPFILSFALHKLIQTNNLTRFGIVVAGGELVLILSILLFGLKNEEYKLIKLQLAKIIKR